MVVADQRVGLTNKYNLCQSLFIGMRSALPIMKELVPATDALQPAIRCAVDFLHLMVQDAERTASGDPTNRLVRIILETCLLFGRHRIHARAVRNVCFGAVVMGMRLLSQDDAGREGSETGSLKDLFAVVLDVMVRVGLPPNCDPDQLRLLLIESMRLLSLFPDLRNDIGRSRLFAQWISHADESMKRCGCEGGIVDMLEGPAKASAWFWLRTPHSLVAPISIVLHES